MSRSIFSNINNDYLQIDSKDFHNRDSLCKRINQAPIFNFHGISVIKLEDIPNFYDLYCAIRMNGKISKLKVFLIHIDIHHMCALTNSLFRPMQPRMIKVLSLTCSRIDSDTAVVLFEALFGDTTLEELSMERNRIGASGLAAAGKFLQHNSTVKRFDISLNDYHHQCHLMPVWKFCDVVCDNRTILELVVDTIGEPQQQLRIDEICARNSVLWPDVHQTIVDVVIAMDSLELPVYVLLWIIDWLPNYEPSHKQYKKVYLIESVMSSIRKVKQLRQ